MIKLADTDRVVLTTAAGRTPPLVFPLPKTLPLDAEKTNSVIDRLMKAKLLAEYAATDSSEIWRRDEVEGKLTLVATEAGLAAVGASESIEANSEALAAAPGPRKTSKGNPRPKAARRKVKVDPVDPKAEPRKGTKLNRLIAALRSKKGATLADLTAATEWQPHSVRGAISGALKKKLGLNVVSSVVDRRGRVYRIES